MSVITNAAAFFGIVKGCAAFGRRYGADKSDDYGAVD